MPDYKKEIIETYNKIASKYSASRIDSFWLDKLEIYKGLIRGKKVIDIGCGTGRDARFFVKNNFDYTGVDISEGMLDLAKENIAGGKFMKMDFYDLDFPDNIFDGFWAAASFLHIPKKEVSQVLKEAKRVIQTGGIGFISIKEKVSMDEGIVKEEKYGGISRYFSFYNQDEFKKILEGVGFNILKSGVQLENNNDEKTNWLYYFIKKI